VTSVAPPSVGRVVFVGAGPGSPDLLTLRGRDWLEAADVVVHDRLVPAWFLAHVPPSATRIPVDRDAAGVDQGRSTGELLVRLASDGATVVRLKGGDPTIFARLAEELEPLHRAGVPTEIVPGVTAAMAAAAAAGIPLTSREGGSSLSLVTGHDARGKPEPVDFRRLAQLPGTLAVYMGTDRVADWSRQLLEAGRAPDTPVTVVSRCSWPDEAVTVTSLAACAAGTAPWCMPAVLLVGPLASAAVTRGGPLHGRVVIVTRPVGQEGTLVAAVRAAGGACLHVPVVRIGEPPDWAPLDAAVAAASSYDWIVFASGNGVRSFVSRLRAAGLDGRALGTARLAAIGPATGRCLEEAGFVCDLVPDVFRSEGLVEAFPPPIRGGRFLLVRADRGREALRSGLLERGGHVDEVVAYSSQPETGFDPAVLESLPDAGRCWITLTSAAIVEAAVRLFGERMRSWRIASLSPVTTAALRRFGLEPDAEAEAATAEDLVAAICRQERDSAPPAPSESAAAPGRG